MKNLKIVSNQEKLSVMYPSEVIEEIKSIFSYLSGRRDLIDSIYIEPIKGGGSDRRFYRITTEDSSFILMTGRCEKSDFRSYIEINKFLSAKGIGVPEIIAFDIEKESALLEDLGNNTLYTLITHEKDIQKIISLYRKALETLVELQIKGKEEIDKCPALRKRIFDYKCLREETDYFKRSFLRKYCNLELSDENELEKEFEILAGRLAFEPLFFMHRDYQSQNIHLKDGKIRIVDFQSAYQGILYYDVASLLKDAYFYLSEEMQINLLQYYLDCLKVERRIKINKEEFVEKFYLAGLQRNMQVLGAFAFLILEKGKKEFAAYIPTALKHLKNGLEKLPNFKVIKAVLRRIALI